MVLKTYANTHGSGEPAPTRGLNRIIAHALYMLNRSLRLRAIDLLNLIGQILTIL